MGVVGGALLAFSRRHGWGSPEFRPLAILALALCAYSCAVVSGTNGFIAAFVGGMAFGTIAHRNDEEGLRLTEEGGTLLSLVVWFAFCAVMLVPGIEDASWRDVVFALLALTVLRVIPVGLALAGCGLDRATVAFVGWFGPRGLASVVFGLIAVDALAPEQSKVVLAAVTVTRRGFRPAPRRHCVPVGRPLRSRRRPYPPAEWRGRFRAGAARHSHVATFASALDSPQIQVRSRHSNDR